MRRVLYLGWTMMLLLGGAASVRAQSVYGPGGLFVNPTANMPPVGQVEPSTLVLTEQTPYSPTSSYRQTTWISNAVDYGFSRRLEIGAASVLITNAPGFGNPSVGGYGKYLLVDEGVARPATAVGVTYLGAGQTGFREGFVALRKKVPASPFVAHAGVKYVDLEDGFAKHDFEPYAGAEIRLLRGWSLAAEGRPRLNFENGTPLALTLVHNSRSGYQVAFTWANNGPSRTPQFGFGVGLAIGSR